MVTTIGRQVPTHSNSDGSIADLADTPFDPSGLVDQMSHNPKERIIMKLGDLNAEDKPISRSFWAPELHTKNKNLTVFSCLALTTNGPTGQHTLQNSKKTVKASISTQPKLTTGQRPKKSPAQTAQN